jgi:hypothetical protein
MAIKPTNPEIIKKRVPLEKFMVVAAFSSEFWLP